MPSALRASAIREREVVRSHASYTKPMLIGYARVSTVDQNIALQRDALTEVRGVFGGTSDNMLRDIRAILQEMSGVDEDFPIDAIGVTIRKAGRSAEFDDFALDEMLARTYGQQQTFLALSLLYDDAGWGTMQFHQDHIFARSLFKPRELSTLGRLNWLEKKDRLGNLGLLLASENIGKQDMPVDEWLRSREPGFLKRHLIPDNQELWKFERFPEFLEAREELVRCRLTSLFAPTAGPGVGICQNSPSATLAASA